MITVAIGDIHGMQGHLARLLREIAAYAESQKWSEPPRLVFWEIMSTADRRRAKSWG